MARGEQTIPQTERVMRQHGLPSRTRLRQETMKHDAAKKRFSRVVGQCLTAHAGRSRTYVVGA